MPQVKSVMNQRGEQGSVSVNAGTSPDGSYADFVVMQDCTVTALTMSKESNNVDDYNGDYPQGFVFYGPLEKVTITSGVIMLHNFIDPLNAAQIRKR
jgi:hypothetical protein